MPLRCVEERRSPTQLDDEADGEEEGDCTCIWQEAPDSLLLHIFSFLEPHDLATVSQVCKKWSRVSYDECLWRNILRQMLGENDCVLPLGKASWRSEVIRILFHTPTVLTETLQEHTDEVLHISFSHDGKLFSTTSKDATLKVWDVGEPTKLRHSKDFRELLGWDFTQFSCFNASDTMVLVSSVKTSSYMDRRGFMAILSLVHDFEILRVVTMDPSQLFGAWLDDTTFLGGSLEISLDRFATTVQIEAYDVPEIFSPLPRLSPTPNIEESAGKHLFTFSSETASLIKFLTVADVLPRDSDTNSPTAPPSETDRETVQLAELSPSCHTCRENQPCSSFTDLNAGTSSYLEEGLSACSFSEDPDSLFRTTENFANDGIRTSGYIDNRVVENVLEKCDICQKDFRIQSYTKSEYICIQCRGQFSHSKSGPKTAEMKESFNFSSSSGERAFTSFENKLDYLNAEKDVKMDCDSVLKDKHLIRPNKLDMLHWENVPSRKKPKARKNQIHPMPDSVTSNVQDTRTEEKKEKQKNLIFVTGEFAVALHQLGFKNVAPYTKESVLARGVTPMDEDNPDGFMVVNYSNNDIHIVRRPQETDKPDNLVDLFGHVTGLCLTNDQRYLFINCRPWIGDVDRTDPWATPDLSPNIEVRIIDLLTLKDLGVRYVGHKGFSPSNMCCFVFLDVSQDYVASGSEDAKGYLWDRHYRSLLANYSHESGVVNAVGFNPTNQEYLATVSDDGLVKIWRSKQEVKRLNLG